MDSGLGLRFIAVAFVGLLGMVGGGFVCAAPVSGAATLSVGRYLGPEEAGTSLLLEPLIGCPFNDAQKIEFYTALERPTDPYLNFSVPKTILTYTHRLSLVPQTTTTLRVGITALELDRWQSDGYMLRPGASLQISKELGSGFTVLLRAGPYVQLNEYTQRTSGVDLTRYGLSERVGLTFETGRVTFDARVLFEQRYSSSWKNDFATYEQVSYALNDSLAVGASHELVSSLVDETTGLYRSLAVFDNRESRISAFVDWKWD